jgi:hypothetical protein
LSAILTQGMSCCVIEDNVLVFPTSDSRFFGASAMNAVGDHKLQLTLTSQLRHKARDIIVNGLKAVRRLELVREFRNAFTSIFTEFKPTLPGLKYSSVRLVTSSVVVSFTRMDFIALQVSEWISISAER